MSTVPQRCKFTIDKSRIVSGSHDSKDLCTMMNGVAYSDVTGAKSVEFDWTKQ